MSMKIIIYSWRTRISFSRPRELMRDDCQTYTYNTRDQAQCSVKVDIFRDYGLRVFRTTEQSTAILRRIIFPSFLFVRVGIAI